MRFFPFEFATTAQSILCNGYSDPIKYAFYLLWACYLVSEQVLWSSSAFPACGWVKMSQKQPRSTLQVYLEGMSSTGWRQNCATSFPWLTFGNYCFVDLEFTPFLIFPSFRHCAWAWNARHLKHKREDITLNTELNIEILWKKDDNCTPIL
jgi:hypothetical protein